MLTKFSMVFVTCFTLSLTSVAASTQLDWMTSIAAQEVRAQYSSVESEAAVKVSDGLTYQVTTSWQDNERVIFHREYPDRIATLGRQGHYFWLYDGQHQKDATNQILDFILGHQYHAQLLFFDQFYLALAKPVSESNKCNCWIKQAKDLYDNSAALHFNKTTLRPEYLVTDYQKHGEVTVQFSDWRQNQKLNFPYHIDIFHEGRKFSYNYRQITLNSRKKYQSLLTPIEKLTDEQQLYRLHRDMIDAHIESDGQLMRHVWGKQITFVNRGKINHFSANDAASQMQQSLNNRKHTVYVDLQPPSIKISNDKSLAYLTARVKAQGNRIAADGKLGASFQFTSAWIATFEKINGQWKLISNASNFET